MTMRAIDKLKLMCPPELSEIVLTVDAERKQDVARLNAELAKTRLWLQNKTERCSLLVAKAIATAEKALEELTS